MTGDPAASVRIAQPDEKPAQRGIPEAQLRIADGAESGDFGGAWTRFGRDFQVVIDLRWCGSEFVAALSDYPLLTESGRTPWEAVHRLIAGHRGLLERRWGS